MSALVENEITINKSYNTKDCFLARAWQGLEMALQPIVNTQANAQQTGQTNELTATELALLSPSEQIIRLRDKNKGTA